MAENRFGVLFAPLTSKEEGIDALLTKPIDKLVTQVDTLLKFAAKDEKRAADAKKAQVVLTDCSNTIKSVLNSTLVNQVKADSVKESISANQDNALSSEESYSPGYSR